MKSEKEYGESEYIQYLAGIFRAVDWNVHSNSVFLKMKVDGLWGFSVSPITEEEELNEIYEWTEEHYAAIKSEIDDNEYEGGCINCEGCKHMDKCEHEYPCCICKRIDDLREDYFERKEKD